jgi:hypothetical protein
MSAITEVLEGAWSDDHCEFVDEVKCAARGGLLGPGAIWRHRSPVARQVSQHRGSQKIVVPLSHLQFGTASLATHLSTAQEGSARHTSTRLGYLLLCHGQTSHRSAFRISRWGAFPRTSLNFLDIKCGPFI